MDTDFSIKGRENYLSQTHHDTHHKFEKWETSFARRTLLQRLIWKFKPNNTYCHLDSYDMDFVHQYEHGFLLVGRVWLLNPNAFGQEIHVAMAIEFDLESHAVKKGRFWSSYMPVIKGNVAPEINIPTLQNLFSYEEKLGRDWKIAFTRNSSEWAFNPQFNLSIFLGVDDE